MTCRERPPLSQDERDIASDPGRLTRRQIFERIAAALVLPAGLPDAAQFPHFPGVRNEIDRLNHSAVDPTDPQYAGGAKFDGISNDTAALLAAAASGRPVRCPPGVALVDTLVFTSDVTIFAESPFKTTLRLRDGNNNHTLYMKGDHALRLRFMSIDGNAAGNPDMRPIYPCAVLVPWGSLDMFGCIVKDARNHCVHTGNTDYDYDGARFAHDIRIESCLFTNGTKSDARGDCVRIHRTVRGRISKNVTSGGLSSIRSNYYCQHLEISDNVCRDNYGDVGVTFGLSSDVAGHGNVCTGNGQHGMEVDACVRGRFSNNKLERNAHHGLHITEYGPPSGVSYSGDVDRTPMAFPKLLANDDCLFVDNDCLQNGHAGISCIGQGLGVTIHGGRIAGNDTANDPNENCGLMIAGGKLNQDGITFGGLTFDNSGNQSFSVRKSNSQFQTISEGNTHIGGHHFEYAIKGTHTRLVRDALSNEHYWTGLAGALLPDSQLQPGGRARVFHNSGGSGWSCACALPLGRPGDKIVLIQLRTTDELASITISADLYEGDVKRHPLYGQAVSLTAAYKPLQMEIPAGLDAMHYDNIRVTFAASQQSSGALSVGGVEIYGDSES